MFSELTPGKKANMLERGNIIDKGIITNVGRQGEIEVESMCLYPGEKTEFAFINGGWKMLFEGPDGDRCFRRYAPTYTFEPICGEPIESVEGIMTNGN